MLAMTPAAMKVINALASTSGLPIGAGLRISATDYAVDEGALRVEVVPGPVEGDQVLTESGARVFVGPEAEHYLDDKVLNAEIDEDGRAQFTLRTQERNHNGTHG
jgi:Fe-S cluster assembly iron-binding protein IscA